MKQLGQVDDMSIRNKTILLVEDEPSFRETIQSALESWGYNVRPVNNGEDALAVFKATRPALVLSDMLVFRMPGLELLKAIRRDDPKAIVILFTAYASLAEAITAMKEGAADIFTKPLDFRRLKQQIDQILEQDCKCLTANSSERFPVPSNSGYRPPECDLQTREQRPQHSFHNAGLNSLPGGRLSAPGPVYRGR